MIENQKVAAVYATRPGSRFPPGATASPEGVNFCVFSRHATRVELLLYAWMYNLFARRRPGGAA